MLFLLSACRTVVLSTILLIPWLAPSRVYGQAGSSPTGSLEAQLVQRLAASPAEASTWRLLGRLRWRRGDLGGAVTAMRRALEIDPSRASTRCDLGRLLLETGESGEAVEHLTLAIGLAPESDYAIEARRILATSPLLPSVAQASFELEPNRFSSIPTYGSRQQADQRFHALIESGVLYNSNVQLAPLSREVFPGGRASVQAFVAPKFELLAWRRERWSAGGSFDAYLNVNESNQRDFNLQSFTPGVFVDRILLEGEAFWLARLAYDFSYDAFALQTFGRRHGVTISFSGYGPEDETLTVFGRVDYADFADDGAVPAVTSLDGWTTTLGAAGGWAPNTGWLEQVELGIDFQWANLGGNLYSYRGVYTYVQAELPLLSSSWLEVQAGWGYRDYYEAALLPSRNENVWRGAVELHRLIDQNWSWTVLFTYDRFASRNVLFEADRYLSGIVLTYEH